MPNWTSFDDETSSALRSKLPEQTIVELPDRSAMEHALSLGETIVAVLPCRGLGQAALAVFRWNPIPLPACTPTPPANMRAGGFLGLTDEPFFEEEETQSKKRWWRRFWDG